MLREKSVIDYKMLNFNRLGMGLRAHGNDADKRPSLVTRDVIPTRSGAGVKKVLKCLVLPVRLSYIERS